ncbi:ArsA-related P-loop ATPase [Enemella sp. A6]|uniref:ArsA-related P-loop ATPase n=1 Tax=Enemella sp. A6 TaxID=3440152 RepID=UPI003EBFCA25
MTAGQLSGHALHIVSGKGGTGKTTVAAALACALATAGRRVLLCEVEDRHAVSELFEVPRLAPATEPLLLRTSSGGAVHGLSIDARSALLEYLDKFYKLGLAGKALDKFGVYDFATSIAPGLRDVLLTGKVYEAVRRKLKNRRNAYDAVVLDAPPTGRIGAFLNVHQAVAGLAKMGPIHNQADSIIRLFRSEHTVVHLVTLLQDMPVTETREAVAELSDTGITVGSVICNRITELPLPADQIVRAAARELPVEVPGLGADENAALAEELAFDAAWWANEQACRTQLEELRLPLIELPDDPAGVDRATLFTLADALARQMPGEVGR